jgi:quinohemoprotein ethanol dehydrogenase
MSEGDDKDDSGWGTFFGVVASFAVGTAIVLAIGVGILIGYFVIGNGGSSSSKSKSTVVATTSTTKAGAPKIESASEIPTAPAFTAAELVDFPSNNWITPPGGTMGDRYSTLKQVNASNVSQLKGDWLTALNGSGTLEKYSQEASPVEYDGVIYIATGADDVFAISASSGKILWEHKANLPASTATSVCCGWDNRGVAIGDGRVYTAVLDGYVEALNQKTGEEEWKTEIAKVTEGWTVTMAPLYEEGMIVIGPVGAEYGVRGFISAYSASTGKQIWKHYLVPGPGEEGHNTWPSNSKAWEHGGATTWNTPTYDPKLGLMYFSTANAGEDFEGKERAGDNLFASSIMALNLKTGKMAWFYQQVHHDIWDFDSPSPTVLINVEANGKMEEGIAEPSKTGYVYFLNRKTGKPIFPIPEVAVPQSAADDTAATQPIPTMAPFSPVTVTPAQEKILQEAVKTATPAGQPVPKVIPGKLFTPWEPSNSKTIESANNVAIGGDNWPPSSFDPANDYYYVCSQSGAVATNLAIASSKKKTYKAGETYTGSNPLLGFIGFDTPGFLTAYSMKTGKIAWQKSFPKESCYSGAVSTDGNVVFSGRNNGEFVAYNATTGQQLWSFQTGAGANAAPAVYEYEGQERIAELAGGNALAGATHGDNLWQFSLTGSKGPVAAGSSAAAIEHKTSNSKENEEGKKEEGKTESQEPKKEEKKEASTGGAAAAVVAGKTLFASNCSVCHGLAGTGGNGGPNLNNEPRAKSVSGVIEQLTNPLGAMPSFKEQLSAKEKEEVADYVTAEITHTSK